MKLSCPMFENENILRMARYCLASLMMLRTTRHPKRMYAVTIYHIFINKYLTPIPYTSSSDIIKKIIETKKDSCSCWTQNLQNKLTQFLCSKVSLIMIIPIHSLLLLNNVWVPFLKCHLSYCQPSLKLIFIYFFLVSDL